MAEATRRENACGACGVRALIRDVYFQALVTRAGGGEGRAVYRFGGAGGGVTGSFSRARSCCEGAQMGKVLVSGGAWEWARSKIHCRCGVKDGGAQRGLSFGVHFHLVREAQYV